MNLVLPNVHDRTHRGFWEAAKRGELVVEMCRPAQHVIHLPMGYCHRCDTFDVYWQAVAGDAVVHTFTKVEHTVDSAFPAPYTIALVELVEVPGVRWLTRVPGLAALTIGQPMELWFDAVTDDVTIPSWRPVG